MGDEDVVTEKPDSLQWLFPELEGMRELRRPEGTGEEEALRALRESEARYRDLVEKAQVAILIDDRSGRFRYFNRKFPQLFGYTAEEIRGHSIRTLVHPEDVEGVMRFHNERLAGKDVPSRYRFRGQRKDGFTVHLEVDVAEILKADGRSAGTRSFIWDVTRSVMAENELRRHRDHLEELVRERTAELTRTNENLQKEIAERERMEAQLLQAQKMEAVGILAGGVAHDFNNLLTTILGQVELALQEVRPGTDLHENLSDVLAASERAADLTRQLLLFSRKQPMEPRPVDLNDCVEGLVRMTRRLLGEDVTIRADLCPDLWTVQGDAGGLEQVLMNLAINARDAMPRGGALIFRTENAVLDGETAREFPEGSPGSYIHLSVSDTGCGMEEEILRHAFEPFFTTKGLGKGTGLGLSVVYGVVKNHGGWITAESRVDRGSTFHVYLPVMTARIEESGPPTPVPSLSGGEGSRVLLVEDDPGVLAFFSHALGQSGYVVFPCATAERAHALFEEEDGEFDLVVSDVVLPQGSGLDLVDALRSTNPDLRVLMTSGYADPKSRWEAIRERRYPFLRKPCKFLQLLKAVRVALATEL
jgi:PAS domain S-box-containing protein